MLRLVGALALLAACGRVSFDDSSCGARDVDTVALYGFESGAIPEVVEDTGQHPGTIRSLASLVPGPCGNALLLETDHFALVSDSPEFDLETGSIELLVRVETTVSALSRIVLSRDAIGIDFDGHMVIGMGENGHVFARLQHTPGIAIWRCSEPIAAQTWTHIGMSFGGDPTTQGFRLWVDHAPATLAMFSERGVAHDCTTPHPYGTAGNNNMLVIGAANWDAANDATEPFLDNFATDTAIDEIHIRSRWRDFTAP